MEEKQTLSAAEQTPARQQDVDDLIFSGETGYISQR